MGHADLAEIPQQMAIAGSCINLATLTAYHVNAGIERTAAAKGRLHAHGTDGDGSGEQILGVEQPLQRKGGARLGAVEQRQSLFRC